MNIFSLGEDTERSVSCTKRARPRPFQKAKRCNRLSLSARGLVSGVLLKGDAFAAGGDYFGRSNDADLMTRPRFA
jgi:hypothetical protein